MKSNTSVLGSLEDALVLDVVLSRDKDIMIFTAEVEDMYVTKSIDKEQAQQLVDELLEMISKMK